MCFGTLVARGEPRHEKKSRQDLVKSRSRSLNEVPVDFTTPPRVSRRASQRAGVQRPPATRGSLDRRRRLPDDFQRSARGQRHPRSLLRTVGRKS